MHTGTECDTYASPHTCIHTTSIILFLYVQGCTEGDVRLLEGSTRLEGRVEICKNNVWGTVCHTGWTVEDARVVCRQLGYSVVGKLLVSS